MTIRASPIIIIYYIKIFPHNAHHMAPWLIKEVAAMKLSGHIPAGNIIEKLYQVSHRSVTLL